MCSQVAIRGPYMVFILWQFKIGDGVKLKSPVDQRIVALATVIGIWEQDLYYKNEIPIGQLMVVAKTILEPDAPLLEKTHPEKGVVHLRDVEERPFLWYQKLMRK